MKPSHALRGVVDLYDVSDDWIPIYDKSSLPGFYMAVGTSGNQFKNAGGVGHLMAELIDACENGWDHDTTPVVVKARFTGTRSRRWFLFAKSDVQLGVEPLGQRLIDGTSA